MLKSHMLDLYGQQWTKKFWAYDSRSETFSGETFTVMFSLQKLV